MSASHTVSATGRPATGHATQMDHRWLHGRQREQVWGTHLWVVYPSLTNSNNNNIHNNNDHFYSANAYAMGITKSVGSPAGLKSYPPRVRCHDVMIKHENQGCQKSAKPKTDKQKQKWNKTVRNREYPRNQLQKAQGRQFGTLLSWKICDRYIAASAIFTFQREKSFKLLIPWSDVWRCSARTEKSCLGQWRELINWLIDCFKSS